MRNSLRTPNIQDLCLLFSNDVLPITLSVTFWWPLGDFIQDFKYFKLLLDQKVEAEEFFKIFMVASQDSNRI